MEKKEEKQSQLQQALVREKPEALEERLQCLGSSLLSPDGSREHAVLQCEPEHMLQ